MIYTFDSYELDPGLRRLQRAGQPIALQPRVFQVLVYLVQHRGRVVTQQELLEQLWSTTFIDRTVVARCVMAARKAIENSGGAPQYIPDGAGPRVSLRGGRGGARRRAS